MKFFSLRLRAGAHRSVRHAFCGLQCILFGGALIAADPLALSATAASRYWITSMGGAFGTAANWSTAAGGAGGASVPGSADVANFTLNSVYTVTFAADTTNQGLVATNGTATLDLGGYTYLLTGAQAATIGTNISTTGRLIIKNGIVGVDTAGDTVSIGSALTSIGVLTVTTAGRLGNGTLDPDLFVGQLGTGTLTVEDNGRADVGFINLGQAEGATGTLSVNGPNAIVDASKSVALGFSGTGTATIQGGGVMNTASYVRLGFNVGSNGTATVTGLGSRWIQSNVLTIGDSGDGSFTIQSGGTVSTAGLVAIGGSASGVGAGIVTGTDSNWSMASGLQIGASGLGNFLVSAAGQATVTGETSLAASAGGRGNAVVTGAGSRWTTGAMTVGAAGTAVLGINTAGVVNTTGNVTLGSQASGVGTAVVTGAGSTWNITGGMTVGGLGSGTLSVDADAVLNTTGVLTLGDAAGAPVGTLNLTGGAITAGGFTRTGASVLNWTDGTFLVSGGAFNNGGANLTINGSDLDDLPALRLGSGAQATAANLPNLVVGNNRQGAAIVSGGANFQTTTASLGALDGGTGTLHVEGQSSNFTTTGDFSVGGTAVTGGGLGTVSLGPGGTVTAGGTLRLWSGGKVTLGGGTLRFNSLAANGGYVEFNSGTIQSLTTLNATAAVLDTLVGTTRVLGTARRLETPGTTLNLQSDLNLSGGGISGNSLIVNSGVILRVGAAGSASYSTVSNPVGARIFVTDSSLAASTSMTNNGDLYLGGTTATVTTPTLTNSGLISGRGRINGALVSGSTGVIRVAAAELLEVRATAGSNINNGLIDLDGGSIRFDRNVTNSAASPSTGMIAARSAQLSFDGGLSNSGALSFTSGVSDVFGNIANLNNLTTPGRIIVTGGAQANFFGDVANSGSIQVSAAGTLQSTAVFLGALSGNGVTGGGHVFIEGDARPGFSPGTMAFGGDVSFGPLSALNIELGGTVAGTQYDRVTVANTAEIDGALNVSLINGFRPVIGNTFQLLTAAGGMAGEFATESLPVLSGGASWFVSYSANAMTLSVGGVLGDFNLDGIVDAADYTVWRNTLGSNSPAADATGNGVVDEADLVVWKANFGEEAAVGSAGGGGIAAAAVPEPASIGLFALAAVGMLTAARRRRG